MNLAYYCIENKKIIIIIVKKYKVKNQCKKEEKTFEPYIDWTNLFRLFDLIRLT